MLEIWNNSHIISKIAFIAGISMMLWGLWGIMESIVIWYSIKEDKNKWLNYRERWREERSGNRWHGKNDGN